METMWKCPVEARHQVSESVLAHKGVTTPRMDADNFTFQWLLAKPATPHVREDRSAQKTSPRKDIESFTFHWLLAELARAHDRELQQALVTRSVPLLAQGHASPRSPVPEDPAVILDGADVATSSHHVQHQQNLLHTTPENAAISYCPPRPTPPNSLMPQTSSPLGFTLSCANGMQKGNTVNHGEELPLDMRISDHSRFSKLSNSSRLSKTGTLAFSKQSKKTEYKGCIAQLTGLLSREEFELAIASVIMLNIFVMCCELQYAGLDVGFNLQYPGRTVSANTTWAGADTAFSVFDWFFGILFFLELVVKLVSLRTKYWYDSARWISEHGDPKDWKMACARLFHSVQAFNVLDFICVVAFIADKTATSSSVVNPQMLRMLRLFRLSRVVRLLRFLETLDHLYVMTTAIASLTKVLAWAIALLTIMLIICDVLLVQILQVSYFDRVTVSDLSDDQLKKHHDMYQYFGTCTRCMLSMFEITLGNWPPVARLLSEEVSEWFTLVCLVHKLTIGFAVIGVITGVILQETFKVAQQDDIIMLRQKQKATKIHRKKMEALFNTLDAERDGKLSVAEFTEIGKNPEIKTWLASLNIETDDLKTLFALIDDDGSGYITLDELFARMPRIAGSARSIDMLRMRSALAKIDRMT